jgi:hypothetical protein
MASIAQYRYKGRFISKSTAARLGNLPSTQKHLATYYRETYRGPSLVKSQGYVSGKSLDLLIAVAHDRQEREDRIRRSAETEERARAREERRREEYERRQVEGPEPPSFPDTPVYPFESYEEPPDIDLGPGGPLNAADYDYFDEYDIIDDWEVADIESEVYEER